MAQTQAAQGKQKEEPVRRRFGFKEEMGPDGRFKFHCHPGLECFGDCCRDVNIYLTPYDVIRLKQALNLTSDEFLARYTLRHRAGRGLPVVQIRMQDNEKKTCPFLTDKGCRVYAARPWSCRMAPVDQTEDGVYRVNFDPARCLGLLESREWTVAEWMEDQGLPAYDPVEAGFRELPGRLQFTGFSLLDEHLVRLFYTVCYNVDRFRRLVFHSRFLEVFPAPPETVERIKTEDVALLRFGLEWLAAGPDLQTTIALRDEAFGDEGLPM
ncbi:MAG: YkgJ family cysteine cluster protein [Thermoanaerobacterales bacterium]|nr:YkgJ family cysteine cluster protein [Thermoanaerobacterales bacterium]